jgi:VWFA-related protein
MVPVAPPSIAFPRTAWLTLLGCIFFFGDLPVAPAQAPSATSQTVQSPQADTCQNASKPEPQASNDEIVSHDSPATFKVRVNLVLVRAVVRDSNGKVITNLKKEDFQLTDDRKLQIISSFSVETPASHVTPGNMDPAEATSEGSTAKVPELPQRFVTLYFDDLHLSTSDVMIARQAATKLFSTMHAGDRFAISTTSGQVEEDFTADRAKLAAAVERILPHPLLQNSPMSCPPMTFFEAYRIAVVNDSTALELAVEDVRKCIPNADLRSAQSMALAAAEMELTIGEANVQSAFQNLYALIRRMSALPGQRTIVLMSPGFFVTPAMHQTGDIIDRATKENIVINTIDARGLYVSSMYDASGPGITNPLLTSYITMLENVQGEVLSTLADGTGGTFFHNRNDIDQGLLQAAVAPEVSYVLGFTPQNMKLDGKYHNLKVTLTNKQKWALQARHGYFAPHGESDPEATAKEEIQQAIFSQEELREVPVECQTQFFKVANGVHLSVVSHVGINELKFRKADERNKDKLTVTTAVFDENGNMLAGQQRVIEMQLKEATLERVNKAGLIVKSGFDLQPGTFLVRIVVRDSEGAQMGATNRGVVIP